MIVLSEFSISNRERLSRLPKVCGPAQEHVGTILCRHLPLAIAYFYSFTRSWLHILGACFSLTGFRRGFPGMPFFIERSFGARICLSALSCRSRLTRFIPGGGCILFTHLRELFAIHRRNVGIRNQLLGSICPFLEVIGVALPVSVYICLTYLLVVFSKV